MTFSRSFLFVPGDDERKLAKATASGADALILDLEDSVADAAKPRARGLVQEFLSDADRIACRLFVRVNALGTAEIADDLEAVARAVPDGVVLPKACGGRDVRRLSDLLDEGERRRGSSGGSVAILPIVTETPASVFAAGTIGPHPRLAGLCWGAEDLSAALGATAIRQENGDFTETFRLARSFALLAAGTARISAVDGVWTHLHDDEGLHRECERAQRDGFRGKLAIHPAQVPVIHAAFAPSREEIVQAREIVAAFERAAGAGVVSLGGRMYDRPHLRKAEALLARTDMATAHRDRPAS